MREPETEQPPLGFAEWLKRQFVGQADAEMGQPYGDRRAVKGERANVAVDDRERLAGIAAGLQRFGRDAVRWRHAHHRSRRRRHPARTRTVRPTSSSMLRKVS